MARTIKRFDKDYRRLPIVELWEIQKENQEVYLKSKRCAAIVQQSVHIGHYFQGTKSRGMLSSVSRYVVQ